MEDFDLIDPDAQQEDPKFSWGKRYQQEILGMLLHDRMFLVQCLQLVKPGYFTDLSHEIICSVLFDYFSEYKDMPGKFVMYEKINAKIKNIDQSLRCKSEFDMCVSAWIPGLETREHCLTMVTEFSKEQSIRLGMLKAIELFKKKDKERFSEIERVLKESILVDYNYDMGLDYFNTFDDRYDRMDKEREVEVFSSGFEGIDKCLVGHGLKRGEIGAYLGLSGTGKSVMLVRAATRNILRGKKVLYVTLEMGQDAIARRFDSQFSRESVRNLLINKEMVKSALSGMKDNFLSDVPDDRRLYIKQFSAGTADVMTLRSFMSQACMQGFRPDLVIVDYVGEMRDYPNMKTYESRQRMVRDLRALGVDENVCMLTALQANRSGQNQIKESGIMDAAALGDSFGQIRPLDALWNICVTVEDKNAGVGGIFIEKHRDGESKKMIYFKQDGIALDFEEISREKYAIMRSQAANRVEDDTEERLNKIIKRPKRDENED